jgi:hypothetical protein
MGHAPRTCRVVKLHIKGKPGGLATGFIVVRHRPHGWQLRCVHQDQFGRLLDEQGNLLPEGEEPVIRESDLLEEVDFNGFDFGTPVERLRETG